MKVPAVLGVLVVCSACNDASAPSATHDVTFATPVPGSDLAVGVALVGEDAIGYVCGGDASFASATRWLIGTRRSDDTFAVSDGAGWTLSGDRRGLITLERPGAASIMLQASGGGDAVSGLYRGPEAVCRTGLVAWREAGALHTQGVWCDGQGHYGQVTPLTPVPYDAAGHIAVHDWTRPGADAIVLLEPLLPP